MVDETSVTPNNGKHIEVTRMSVGSAEVKDMQVDLLEAVNASIGAQTETFQKEFAKTRKDGSKEEKATRKSITELLTDIKNVNEKLISVMRDSNKSGEGGEGGGGGTGLGIAEMEVRKELIETIGKAAEKGAKFGETMKSVNRILGKEFKVATAAAIEALLETTHSIISFRTAVDQVTTKFARTMELSKSGIATFSDVWIDDLDKTFDYLNGGLSEARDNMVETTELISRSLQSGLVSPMQLVGGDLHETARAFADLREDMEDSGLDLYKNLGFREQNDVFAQLLDVQLRGDRMTNIREDSTRAAMREQISALRIISENTGLSLDVLVDSSRETLKTLANIEATGLLTKEESKRLGPALTALQRSSPQAADMMKAIIESRGDEAAFIRDNKERYELLQRTGQTGLIQKSYDLIQGRAGGIEAANIMGKNFQGLADSIKFFGEQNRSATKTMLGSNFEYAQTLASGMNTFKELIPGMGGDSAMARGYNKLADFFTNTFPIADTVKFLASIGFNTFALGANTMALMSNTASRMKGGMLKGLMGGLAKVGSVLGKVLKWGGVISGGLMIAKDALDIATGDASGQNIGGVIGGAIGGVAGGLLGTFAMPGVGTGMGAAGGMAVGNMAGNWVGSMFDDDGTGGVPGAAPTPSPITRPTSASKSRSSMPAASGSRAVVANQMLTQTRLLESIAGSMHTSNSLQKDIRDRIGFSGTPGEAKQRDSTKKGSNIAVVPARLGF